MNKCQSCGAELKQVECLYCGSLNQFSQPHPNQGTTHTTTHTTHTTHTTIHTAHSAPPPKEEPLKNSISQAGDIKDSISWLIGKLIICFFFGIFGGHYFYEKRWKMGLLYLFTMAFYGIGWLIDMVRISVALHHKIKTNRI